MEFIFIIVAIVVFYLYKTNRLSTLSDKLYKKTKNTPLNDFIKNHKYQNKTNQSNSTKKSYKFDFNDLIEEMDKDYVQDPDLKRFGSDNGVSYQFLSSSEYFKVRLLLSPNSITNKIEIHYISNNIIEHVITNSQKNEFINRIIELTNTKYNEFSFKHENRLYTDIQIKAQDKYKKLVKVYNARARQGKALPKGHSDRKTLRNEMDIIKVKMDNIYPKTGYTK